MDAPRAHAACAARSREIPEARRYEEGRAHEEPRQPDRSIPGEGRNPTPTAWTTSGVGSLGASTRYRRHHANAQKVYAMHTYRSSHFRHAGATPRSPGRPRWTHRACPSAGLPAPSSAAIVAPAASSSRPGDGAGDHAWFYAAVGDIDGRPASRRRNPSTSRPLAEHWSATSRGLKSADVRRIAHERGR